jgi:hypothetical protein
MASIAGRGVTHIRVSCGGPVWGCHTTINILRLRLRLNDRDLLDAKAFSRGQSPMVAPLCRLFELGVAHVSLRPSNAWLSLAPTPQPPTAPIPHTKHAQHAIQCSTTNKQLTPALVSLTACVAACTLSCRQCVLRVTHGPHAWRHSLSSGVASVMTAVARWRCPSASGFVRWLWLWTRPNTVEHKPQSHLHHTGARARVHTHVRAHACTSTRTRARTRTRRVRTPTRTHGR